MTLFLACLVIYWLHLPEWLYIISGLLWLLRLLILWQLFDGQRLK